MQEELLIICPNESKKKILEEKSSKKKLIPIKFMDINEFIDNYYFSYDNKTISYIITKYNTTIDVATTYIKTLYVIDINNIYNNTKLEFLRELKIDLINNKLLTFNHNFKEYLKIKKIQVINYPNLDKYLVNTFKELNSYIDKVSYKEKELTVLECSSIYDEVLSVINKIIELKNNGVSLNNIHIINYSSDYYYTMSLLFSMFNININLKNTSSISSSLLVKKYLDTKEMPIPTKSSTELINKLTSSLNELVLLEGDSNYDLFLKEKLNNTYLNTTKYTTSVNISDLFNRTYTEDDYVFLIGFNEGILPRLYKDEEFITDEDKLLIDLYTTKEKNIIEKENTINYITNIPNLYISYKLSSFKDTFYSSSMIEDYSITVKHFTNTNYQYSNKYNNRMLSIYLDNYYKYKEENKYLKSLLKTYPNKTYNTYTNIFKGIDKSLFIDYIKKIGLSYTSMNTYNLCSFKYYINYILKLDPYEETFATFIGNLFHHILELFLTSGFDFESSFNDYLKDKDLSIKEMFFLEKLKKNLQEELDLIKEQRMYTDFKDNYYEKNIYIPLSNSEIESYFSGKIDKIMYYNNKLTNKTYFAIVDYKTGGYEASLNNMKYGLGMQLATYLYLIRKGNIFTNPVFAGMYFQKVLMGNVSYDGRKSYLDKLKDNLKLDGYSTDDEDVLSHFDHEYTNSYFIKSMKVGASGFSRYTKLLNEEEIDNIFNFTEKVIGEVLNDIINTKFDINPKLMDGVDISCKYCKYHDICYKSNDDYVRLKKNTDLGFLEGDRNGE